MHTITRALLKEFNKRDASDLHLAAGYPPTFRIEGVLVPYGNPISNDTVLTFIEDLVGRDVILKINEREEVDLSARIQLDGQEYRFRLNIALFERKHFTVLRRLKKIDVTPQDLLIPEAFTNLVVNLQTGVIFVTGPTGSGKSTTLAATLAYLLQQKPLRVITLEDPIEYEIPPGLGMVTQREIEWDTKSFGAGLRAAMRQDPDVILVGEVRDAETALALLSAAETGHLVLTTMHVSAVSLIPERLGSFFSTQIEREAVISRLAGVFQGAITQSLVPTISQKRILAWEYLESDNMVRRALTRGNKGYIRQLLKERRTRLADCLIRLMVDGIITEATARSFLNIPDEWDAGYVQELKDMKKYTEVVSGLPLKVCKQLKLKRTSKSLRDDFFWEDW